MKRIPLSGNRGKGLFALVDDEDFEELSRYRWHLNHAGYAQRSLYERLGYYDYKNSTLPMHKQIMMVPEGKEVDHANRIKLDNQRGNLREASKAENGRNVGRRKVGGFKGVYWQSTNKRWWAMICVNYKRISLGTYLSPLHAARAYNAAATKYHGEFAVLNDLSDFENCV